ncbi:TPA: hypothetical protein QFK41_001679, partial [Enterococcus faecium]
ISPTNSTNNKGIILFKWITFFLLSYRALPVYFAPPKRRGRLVRNKNHSLSYQAFFVLISHILTFRYK